MVQRSGRNKRLSKGLESVLIEGEWCVVGRLPSEMRDEDWAEVGHVAQPLLKVIRQRCMDCCTGSMAEVRRCVAVDCVSWPYRMGKTPFRKRVKLEGEALAAKREAMAKARALRGKGS